MINAQRKKEVLEVTLTATGACSGTHSVTVDVVHNFGANKKLEYSLDNETWLDAGLPPSNPWTGLVIASLACDGEDHNVYFREEGNPSNNDMITYTAPLGADFVSIRTGVLETVVSNCLAGVYSIKIYADYALTSGDLQWKIDGGGWTSYAPGASPDIEIIGPFACDGATGKTLTVESVDAPAATDTWVFDAPAAACTLSLTNLAPSLASGGTFSLDIEATYTNVTGDLQYKIDSGSWVAFTPSGSPHTETITGLVADGLTHDIEIQVVDATSCTVSGNYIAPSDCVLDLIRVTPRENTMNLYSIAFDYELTDVAGDLQWSLDGGSYTAFTPPASTGIFQWVVLNLVPDGANHTFELRSASITTCSDSVKFTSPVGCSAATARDNDVWKANYIADGNLQDWNVEDGVVEQQSPMFNDYKVYYYNSSSMIADCPSWKENTLDVAEAALPAGLSTMEVDSWFGIRLRITGTVYSALSTLFTVRIIPFTNGGTPLASAEIAAYKAVETIGVTPTTITYLGDTVDNNSLELDSDSNVVPLPGVLNYLSFYLDDSYTTKDLYYYFRVCTTDVDAGQFYFEFIIEDELLTG